MAQENTNDQETDQVPDEVKNQPMVVDLSKMTTDQLKVFVYDLNSDLAQINRNINAANQIIAQRMQEGAAAPSKKNQLTGKLPNPPGNQMRSIPGNKNKKR